MNAEPSSLEVAAPVGTIVIIANPGVQAVRLPWAQMIRPGGIPHELAPAVSMLNLPLPGAEFVVGCRISPPLARRHPRQVVIRCGAAIDEDCAILHRVTLGERDIHDKKPCHNHPQLGARVVVAGGAAIVVGVRVRDVVSSNAVVVRDTDAADDVAGVPARSARKAGNERHLKFKSVGYAINGSDSNASHLRVVDKAEGGCAPLDRDLACDLAVSAPVGQAAVL